MNQAIRVSDAEENDDRHPVPIWSVDPRKAPFPFRFPIPDSSFPIPVNQRGAAPAMRRCGPLATTRHRPRDGKPR